ncbi:MAG: ExbD/TolR family protein [Aestuariibaculum sp.]
MAKRAAPEVNAGSMADIAFLLLIFFLVTTTIEVDSGINRKLPPMEDERSEPPRIKQKNLFTVLLNREDQLMVEEEVMDLKDLRQAAIDFLDNGADGTCDYCQGKRDQESSDNPDKAIISLKNDRNSTYKTYIAVQNELVAAYNDLRDRRAEKLYGKSFKEMEANLDDVNWPGNKDKLKTQIEQIKKDYPQKLSEVQ